jgi:hypothetical protein
VSSVRRQNDDGRGPVLRLLRRPDLRAVRRFTRSAPVIQTEVPVVWQGRRGAVSRLVDRGPRGGLSQKSKKGRRAGALLARGHGGRAQRGGAGAPFALAGRRGVCRGSRRRPPIDASRRWRLRRQHASDAIRSTRVSRRWRLRRQHAIDARASNCREHGRRRDRPRRPSTSTARPASTTASCQTDCGGGFWRSNRATRRRPCA